MAKKMKQEGARSLWCDVGELRLPEFQPARRRSDGTTRMILPDAAVVFLRPNEKKGAEGRGAGQFAPRQSGDRS
jgi:hypothetical protein